MVSHALYGHKYVVPVIASSGLNDLSGNPITGFPGFGGISGGSIACLYRRDAGAWSAHHLLLHLRCARQCTLFRSARSGQVRPAT